MPVQTKKRKRDTPEEDAASDAGNSSSGSESADGDGDVKMVDNATDSAAGAKKKGLSVHEMRNIKQNAQLFNSNTFHFQIDSLLPNVAPKASHVPQIEKFLHELHSHLMELSDVQQQHPLSAARDLAKRGIAVPYPLPLPSEDTNWKVAFKRPSDISIVGSWGNKTTVKRQDGAPYSVDIAVEMPADLFQEKDYLNSRFFHKRAFYLATLADSIKSNDALDVEIMYDSADYDARKTCLVLKPRLSSSKLNAVVRIIPSLSSTAPIPATRLSPTQNNLRTSDTTPPPTPMYNNALAQTRLPKTLLLAIHNWVQLAPSFGDALRLLRVWAAQRGFSSAGSVRVGTVAGFAGRGAWWPCILGVLLTGEEEVGKSKKRRTVGRGLSSYQLFRAALDFLANRDFRMEPVYMKRNGDPPFNPELFASPAFIEPSSTVNLLSGMPIGSLEHLRHEARATLIYLDNADDPFPGTFLRDARGLSTRFDIVLKVALSSVKAPSSLLDAGSTLLALQSDLPSLAARALGNRAHFVVPLLPHPSFRPLGSPRPTSPSSLLLGIRLDPTHATRIVDHGPPPEAPEADEFRRLWGSKAETRRFKDGRIIESVVWENIPRHLVPVEIVRHVLNFHFGVQASDVSLLSPSYDLVLGGAGDASWRAAMSAFDGLAKTLKTMDPESGEGIPLSLVSILPVAEGLRYSSPLAPRSVPTDTESFGRLDSGERYISPLDAVLAFEQSGRWPDDLAAVQKMKLVFLERIAAWTIKHVRGAAAHVALDVDADDRPLEDNCSLEVLLREGFAFRFRIYHNREATLLKRMLEKRPPALVGTAPSAKDQEAARKALALHTSRFVEAPKHHAALAALHHARPTYSATVRLLKRWLAAHCLLPHIPTQAIELLSSIPFVSSDTAHVPGSAGAGFACILAILCDWDFALNPLFIPTFAEDGTAQVRVDDEKRKQGAEGFKTMRARDPSQRIAWCLPTEADVVGTAWTNAGPSKLVANRVRAVARASSKFFDVADNSEVAASMLFTHPLDDYDFILHLDPKILTRAAEFVLATPPPDQPKGYANQPVVIGVEESAGPLVGFDPAIMLFDDLRRAYAEVAEFFFDPLGGRTIGGVWDPSIRKSHTFRVFLGFNSKIAPGTSKKPPVVLNEDAILAEMERFGRGIIARVVKQVSA